MTDLERIREKLIESDLAPHDLKIVLDIIYEVERERGEIGHGND